MHIFKKDSLGHSLFLKRVLINILGAISYRRYFGFNKLTVVGLEKLKVLPEKNVLFISNHQTYFSDVAAMLHVFNAENYRQKKGKHSLWYLLNPRLDIYYIAALETMKSGILPRLLAYTGSISIERTWRLAGKEIKRKVKISDVNNIKRVLKNGWVITFPQGTTKPFAPVRRGTSHIVKNHKPIVVPIVIDGFRKAFDKKGLKIKRKNCRLTMRIKAPLQIDYEEENNDEIAKKIAEAIEQVPPTH